MRARSNTTALSSLPSNLDAQNYRRYSQPKRKRCRLDGGEDEGGTLRLPNVDVVPAPEPAHVLREKMQAADEGRAMRHPYRGMPLTGAPAARFPKYLWAKRFNDYEDLDDNGHAPETLDIGASEHDAGCDTGWIDHADCYILDGDRQVKGVRKVNGSMATGRAAGRSSAIQRKLGYGRALLLCLQPFARTQAHVLQEH